MIVDQAEVDAYRPPDAAALRARLGYMSDDEVAALLGITVPTLRNRRSRGDAPPSSRSGYEHLTAVEDVKRYLASRRRRGGE